MIRLVTDEIPTSATKILALKLKAGEILSLSLVLPMLQCGA
jgi:hypothetical protein